MIFIQKSKTNNQKNRTRKGTKKLE